MAGSQPGRATFYAVMDDVHGGVFAFSFESATA
jgi:hypothetical protein